MRYRGSRHARATTRSIPFARRRPHSRAGLHRDPIPERENRPMVQKRFHRSAFVSVDRPVNRRRRLVGGIDEIGRRRQQSLDPADVIGVDCTVQILGTAHHASGRYHASMISLHSCRRYCNDRFRFVSTAAAVGERLALPASRRSLRQAALLRLESPHRATGRERRLRPLPGAGAVVTGTRAEPHPSPRRPNNARGASRRLRPSQRSALIAMRALPPRHRRAARRARPGLDPDLAKPTPSGALAPLHPHRSFVPPVSTKPGGSAARRSHRSPVDSSAHANAARSHLPPSTRKACAVPGLISRPRPTPPRSVSMRGSFSPRCRDDRCSRDGSDQYARFRARRTKVRCGVFSQWLPARNSLAACTDHSIQCRQVRALRQNQGPCGNRRLPENALCISQSSAQIRHECPGLCKSYRVPRGFPCILLRGRAAAPEPPSSACLHRKSLRPSSALRQPI